MPRHFTGGSQKTIAKLIILEEYLDIYTTILRERWEQPLWYVDSHAGTGKTVIDQSGRTVDGSAIRAIENHRDDFEAFYLYELDPDHFTVLHETLSDRFDIDFEVRETLVDDEDFLVARCDDPKIVIMQVDSNDGVSFLAEESREGRHWFTFIDPKGLTAKKSTLETLIDRENMDILINYQTSGVMRSAAEGAEHAHDAVTRTMGDDDWPNAGDPEDYVCQYCTRLENTGAFQTVSQEMVSPRDERWRFDLVFASKNEKARELMKGRMEQDSLWEKAAEESGQTGFNQFM